MNKKNINETYNQRIIQEYKSFVSENPDSLPKTEVFDEINKIYPSITRETVEEIQNDKEKSLFTLFNITHNVKQFLQDPTNSPLNVTLLNNSETNLYYFLTKVLYFNKRDVFETGTINISKIKTQLGKDLHRAGSITINGIIIPNSELVKFQEEGENDKEVDYFNLKLMDSINENLIPISLNSINIIDLSCIQQNIQFVSDLFVSSLAKHSIMQKGGNKKLNIIMTSDEQYIEYSIESELINIVDFPPPLWGRYNILLKINIKDLSYSFKVDINKIQISESNLQTQSESAIQEYTNKISNTSKAAIDYAKANPGTVATGVGATAILGSTAGMLFLAGVLGGKPKKHSHKKHKSKKINCKNKKISRKNKKHINKHKHTKTNKNRKHKL